MYYVKMTFTPFTKEEITENNVEDMDMSGDIWGYLGDLRRFGQIYKDNMLIYSGCNFQAFFFMPELDSLDEKYCSNHVIKGHEEIKKEYAITTEVLGQNAVVNELCTCRDPSWYFLYTRRNYAISPIVCGDCFKMIPAYKLFHVELPPNCQSELGWQMDYELIDELWFLSSFDHFTYYQMSDPESQLSRSGREICAAYEKELDKPFYYFLFYYDEFEEDRKLCPICRSEWMLKENIGILTCKCDKCRLVSC